MLKRGRKWAAALVSVSLIGAGLIGCGNSEEPVQSGENNVSTDNSGGDNSQADAGESEDVAEISVAFYNTFVPNEENTKRIEDAINAITIPEINTQVDLTVINMGQWDQQINLMISSGEKLDLMPTFFGGSTTFANMSSSNQLTPLNDLLDEYGQGILDVMPEKYLETTTINGNIYAAPIYSDKVSTLYYAMRTDVLEELGLTEQAQNLSSMQDIEELLKIVKEKTDLVPICETSATGVITYQGHLLSGKFEDIVFLDQLLNDYIVSTFDNPNEVTCLYDLDEYKECASMFQRWFSEGLINQDATSSEQHAEYHISTGNTFSTFFGAEYSTKTAFETKAQYPMTIIKVADFPLTTSSINKLTWVIPVTSDEPEAAMKFMNMMYTDKRIVDLLNYGQVDVDYAVNEDGTYGFMEGQDVNSTGYHFETSWLFGNQFLAGVWEGDAPTLREEALKINEDAQYSPLFGFSATSEGLDTQIAGVLSACNEYANALQLGTIDVEENLPKFQEKLKAAGIDEIKSNIQSQLDTWLQAHNEQ